MLLESIVRLALFSLSSLRREYPKKKVTIREANIIFAIRFGPKGPDWIQRCK